MSCLRFTRYIFPPPKDKLWLLYYFLLLSNKLPWIWRCRITQLYSLTVLKAKKPVSVSPGWDQGVSRTVLPLELVGDRALLCLFHFLKFCSLPLDLWPFLCFQSPEGSIWLQLSHCLLSLWSDISLSPSNKTLVINFRAHPGNPEKIWHSLNSFTIQSNTQRGRN